MEFQVFVVVCYIIIISCVWSQFVINTNLMGPLRAQGIYWDIEAINTITLVAFAFVNFDNCPNNRQYTLELYVRNALDSYVGFENNSSAWNLLQSNTLVGSCSVEASLDIAIPGNNKLGFFVYIVPQDNLDPDQIITMPVDTTLNEGDVIVTDNQLINVLAGTVIEVNDPIFNRTNDTRGYEPGLFIIYLDGTISPTSTPTRVTNVPTTNFPSNIPTMMTIDPSMDPSDTPTQNPTSTPSAAPTQIPTLMPSAAPTNMPSSDPTTITTIPTIITTVPSSISSITPSIIPSNAPTNTPTASTPNPTATPSQNPSNIPTLSTMTPSISTNITESPTISPSNTPSMEPTHPLPIQNRKVCVYIYSYK